MSDPPKDHARVALGLGLFVLVALFAATACTSPAANSSSHGSSAPDASGQPDLGSATSSSSSVSEWYRRNFSKYPGVFGYGTPAATPVVEQPPGANPMLEPGVPPLPSKVRYQDTVFALPANNVTSVVVGTVVSKLGESTSTVSEPGASCPCARASDIPLSRSGRSACSFSWANRRREVG